MIRGYTLYQSSFFVPFESVLIDGGKGWKKKDKEDMRVKQTYGARFPECHEVLIFHHSSSQKIKY